MNASPSPSGPDTAEHQIRITATADETGEAPGQTRVELLVAGHAASRLYIVPFTIRIGAATVRMDGIAGVGTEEEHRNRGYARHIMQAAVEHMRQGDAALTMLYGISDFYHRFDYTTAGPDHLIHLTHLEREPLLPEGWTARPFEPDDLASVQRLYDLNTQHAVGVAVRAPDSYIWSHLTRQDDGDSSRADGEDNGNAPSDPSGGERGRGCRVVLAPDGNVRAYTWCTRRFWYPDMLEGHDPDGLVFSEVMADGPTAADAVLAACRQWTQEISAGREQPYRYASVSQPPEGPVAAAAAFQDARFVFKTSRSGDSMARVLDVERLLSALKPELIRRLEASRTSFRGSIEFVTDIGEATLALTEGDDTLTVHLPQTALARLALGAYDPADLLNRLDAPLDERTRALLLVLFPQRHPHMSLPDRF